MHQGKHREDKPLPSTIFYLKPQRSVIAAHIISSQQHPAPNCSVRSVNAERSLWYGLKSKFFPPLNPAWLLLEQCAADAVSQSRLEEGPDLCGLLSARSFRGIWREPGSFQGCGRQESTSSGLLRGFCEVSLSPRDS